MPFSSVLLTDLPRPCRGSLPPVQGYAGSADPGRLRGQRSGVVRAQALGTDVLDASCFHDSTHGAAGDNASTFGSGLHEHAASEKLTDDFVGMVSPDICTSTRQPVRSAIREELHRTHPLIAGVLEVGDAADDVGAQANGFFHQFTAIAERLDAFPGERPRFAGRSGARFLHALAAWP